jgi:HSP20 family molecular chaperone IbpA
MSEFLVDIWDRGSEFLVEVALPGVLEPDIDVTLAGALLIIHAERPALAGRSLHAEIPRGIFARRVELPGPSELVSAWYEDGILSLVLRPKEGGP